MQITVQRHLKSLLTKAAKVPCTIINWQNTHYWNSWKHPFQSPCTPMVTPIPITMHSSRSVFVSRLCSVRTPTLTLSRFTATVAPRASNEPQFGSQIILPTRPLLLYFPVHGIFKTFRVIRFPVGTTWLFFSLISNKVKGVFLEQGSAKWKTRKTLFLLPNNPVLGEANEIGWPLVYGPRNKSSVDGLKPWLLH